MSARSIGWKCGILVLILVGPVVARQDQEGGPDAPDVLTRGPIHEAYAEPVIFDPQPGIVVPKAPPGPIEEQPPDQSPEGNDVQWISGYWSWDDEREDFIWISGIWRDIPPDRQWMPGYWSEEAGGFQWTSGFWGPLDQEEVEYLPTPPQSLEVGANTPAPSDDHVWTPGYWTWRDERYVWAPGYWVAYQPDWVWVPPTYNITPSGCIFVGGYWDYTLANRGLLFAPVYINRVVYTQPNFVYTPAVTIDSYALTDHFFCRPSYRHYYFGDYYDAGPVAAQGIEPWFAVQQRQTWYDPIYSHTRVVSIRNNPSWETRVRETYRYRTVHVDARPARTFVAQQAIVARRQDAGPRPLVLARTLAQAGREDGTRLRLERVDQARRAELGQRQQALQQLREQRSRLEAQTQARRQDTRERLIIRKQDMLRSPVAARAPLGRPGAGRPRPGVDAPINSLGAGGGPDPQPGPRTLQGQLRPDVAKRSRAERAQARPAPDSVPTGPGLPEAQPKRALPRDLPKAERPKAQPGPRPFQPGSDLPQGQPKRALPRDLPKSERPKAQAEPRPFQPGSDRPQGQPKRALPRDLPKAERPKAQPGLQPFQQPGLDLPKAQPRPETPRIQPGPRPPQPKLERPKAQPKGERNKRQAAARFTPPDGAGPVVPLGSATPLPPSQPRPERPNPRPRIEARSAVADRPGPRASGLGPRPERLRSQAGIGLAQPAPSALPLPVPTASPRPERPRPQPEPRQVRQAQPGQGAGPNRIGAGPPGQGQAAQPPRKAESPKAQRKQGQLKKDRER